jgi:hypothetical protein
MMKSVGWHCLLIVCLAIVLTCLTPERLFAQSSRPELPQPPSRPDLPQDPPQIPDLPVLVEAQGGNGNGRETGQIHLQTQPGAHTMVQWQNGSGAWHNVEGWRAQSGSGSVTWAVDQKDLGSGPFRWVSYAPNGRIIASSFSFNLPTAGQTLNVNMPGGWQGGYVEQRQPDYNREWQRPQQPRQWNPPVRAQPRQPNTNQWQQRRWQPQGQYQYYPQQRCHRRCR